MLLRRSSLTLSALLLAGAVAFQPADARADSVGHSAQAAQHSGAAASHGAAGLASAGASAVAVPMVGAGAASRAVGHVAGQAGTAVGGSGRALFEAANPGLPLTLGPAPDAPPRLD